MAFDVDFLNGVLGNEETSIEDKVTQLMAEHNASENGLILKRDELLGANKKLKGEIEGFNSQIADRDARLTELEDKLNKSTTDKESSKEYWQGQFNKQLKDKDDAYADLSEKYKGLQSNYYRKLKNEAVSEAVKDLQFVEGLQGGFTATVLMNNDFEPTNIDGEIVFLNKANKTIKDVMHEFALTSEGKSYLKNPSSGGNAYTGNTGARTTSVGGNEITREQYAELVKNPEKFAEFRKTHSGWKIVG